ncbi:MAG TPA: M20/M25/M40 family metallo-hydrolase, partial [Phycisphaerales bacterium]|nr:M20/M25/M40 family metallo-hydrolase [Phycisphaerales bacterium]
MTVAPASTPSPREPLSTAEERLVRAIAARHAALVEDLERFVNTPTGRAPHAAALEGLAATRSLMRTRLEALGAVSELVPGDPRPGWLDGPVHFRDGNRQSAPIPSTLVCRREGSTGRSVLLSGHLDTVHDPDPAAPFRTLSVAPGGKTATGPGVVDMKGGLVIALHALEALAEVDLDVPFGFILNSDEETGSFHSDRALRAEASRRGPTDGVRAYAAALALEPANGPTGLVLSRGGSGQAVLEARGKAAHVGRDFAVGRSATDLLARVIVAAHGLNDVPGGSIINVSTLWCDQPANQVSDHAAAWANLRYPTQRAGEHLAAGLYQICARVGGDDVERG